MVGNRAGVQSCSVGRCLFIQQGGNEAYPVQVEVPKPPQSAKRIWNLSPQFVVLQVQLLQRGALGQLPWNRSHLKIDDNSKRISKATLVGGGVFFRFEFHRSEAICSHARSLKYAHCLARFEVRVGALDRRRSRSAAGV